MKVQGLSIGDGGLQRLSDKQSTKVSPGKPQKGDLVELSRSAQEGDVAEMMLSTASEDFSARSERVESAARSVANGAYYLPELLQKVAEKIIETGESMQNLSEITADKNQTPTQLSASMKMVDSQAVQTTYSQPDVITKVAGRLIDTIGF
ncbi:hypothetical protein LLG96_13305 [bacterium]|nr:hypothetical protein [bacterium]